MIPSSLQSGITLSVEILILLFQVSYGMLESLFQRIIPKEEKSVDGEIVLITGAGHGIGKELALKYGQLNSTVICVDVNAESNEKTAEMVNKLNKRKAYFYRCNVAKEEEVKILAAKVKQEVGTVSILVNNAGIMPCHKFFTFTSDEIHKLFGVNVFAHVWMLQNFVPDMLKANHGHIITLSSMAGLVGMENLTPYCATKFAVRGMVEALHQEIILEFPDTDVKFTTIYPYIVDTGLCQKPIVRFPNLLGVVSVEEAADQILQASRRNLSNHSIPPSLLTTTNFFRLLPEKVVYLLKKFIGTSVGEHDKEE